MDLAPAPAGDVRALVLPRDPLTNRRGFALVLFLAVLPVLMACGFALGATGLMVSDHRAASNTCRGHLLEGQRQAAIPMRQLLALNPMAKALRLQILHLTAAMAANAGNPGVLIALGARLARARQQQMTLDRLQKTLFTTAQIHLRASQALAVTAFVSRAQWLTITPRIFKAARPALRPRGPGPAPEWEKMPVFSRTQTMEQKWLWSLRVRGPAARFLKAAQTQEETCAATLDDSKDPWIPQLR